MTDREKLDDLFADGKCPAWFIDNKQRLDTVDYLIANGVTVNEWRPASELPKNDYEKHWKDRQYYLVRLAPSGLMRVAKYGYKEHDWWIDAHDCVLGKARYTEVTHWMPLPQPPKEVE